MLRKVGILLCMLFLSQSPVAQASLAAVILAIASHAQLKIEPYKYRCADGCVVACSSDG